MEREKLKVGKIHWIDFSAAAAVTLLACACLSVKSSAQDPGQKTFSSPEEASDSLVKAAQSNDEKTLIEILGREAKEIVSSGDHAEDSENRANFVKRYDQMHRLVREPDGTVSLYIGAENWPTPIPLVRKGSAWYFDTEAAKTEILFRRVGRNEMSTIRVCEELVASQKEYYASHQKEYALKSVSDQGQKDGLYWEAMNGESQSPIGPLLAAAITADSSGNRAGTQTPFHGYYFRILTRQGKNAPGGAKNYVTNGKLTGGFAFLAYPAEYRASGVMTFLVTEDGVVYQKDLGKHTESIVKGMKVYNPDSTWQKAEEQPQETATK